MSNPVEINYFSQLPAELQVQIIGHLPPSQIPSLRRVSKEVLPVVETLLIALKNALERSPPEGPINLTGLMGRIAIGPTHLDFFKTLCGVFADAGAKPKGLVATPAEFAALQRQAEDVALVAVWPRILRELDIDLPQITTAEQIRNWMDDPNNSALLMTITRLNLSKLNLRVFPTEIILLTRLQRLDLSDNQLSSLPDAIGLLSQLQNLYLTNNQLSSLPDAIGDLSLLQGLYLTNNKLSSLPDSIGALIQLQELNLMSNQLSSLPDEIGALIQLQELDLSYNQLSSLPATIEHLTQLQKLDLSYNRLFHLSPLSEPIEALPLVLTDMQHPCLPDAIAALTQLQELDLTGNEFSFFLAVIPFDVGFGNTLGIRCETNWQESIPFTYTSSGWSGRIPADKAFKFIVIPAEGEVRWEKGENRLIRLKSESDAAQAEETVSRPPEF